MNFWTAQPLVLAVSFAFIVLAILVLVVSQPKIGARPALFLVAAPHVVPRS